MKLMWRVCLLATLGLGFGSNSYLIAQQGHVDQQAPLNETEERETLSNLVELPIVIGENEVLIKAKQQLNDLLAREKEFAEQRINFEKDKQKILEERLAEEKRQKDEYKTMFDRLAKKPSIGCRVVKFFTLGLKACT